MASTKKTCTLCNHTVEKFSVTGIKVINNQEAPYQLCLSCCQELHGLSFYSPTESKKRRDFWNKVWKCLELAQAA
ncbi:MAG: hypothetical protein KIT27_00030 [Legionellales bacterium]|nr:hypothetical protein [Legionellales bacterium]